MKTFYRKKTRVIYVRKIPIGCNNPIVVQSMTNTDTKNVNKTLKQIYELASCGCEIVRVAIPKLEYIQRLKKIIEKSPIPVVADVHFDHRIAIEAIKAGADCIRINPGNIGGEDKVKEIILCLFQYKIPVRIGVNVGSLPKKYRNTKNRAEAMVAVLLENLKIFEKEKFKNIKVSLKLSEVMETIEANRLYIKERDYPIHLGLTEAGIYPDAAIRSATCFGILLSEGIGDTVRVSITGNPVLEVETAYEILSSLGLKSKNRPHLISCPTCGRLNTKIDLESIAKKINDSLKNIKKNFSVAVMGCEVNGPGEARNADIGIAFGRDTALIFKKGRPCKKIDIKEAVDELIKEVKSLL
ncbi:MAG: flavodoxin-dependent (E)-4-hydroxy-3-methylbut-2-enyl-diphosphate synthase [Candidatus Hydrogenedentota bacterium]